MEAVTLEQTWWEAWVLAGGAGGAGVSREQRQAVVGGWGLALGGGGERRGGGGRGEGEGGAMRGLRTPTPIPAAAGSHGGFHGSGVIASAQA